LVLGGASAAAMLAALGIDLWPAQSASAATIADPWGSHIKSWNYNWAQHRAAGYEGGQDYAFDFGNPIYAPAAGTLNSGSAGISTFTLAQPISRIVAAEAGESGNVLTALQFLHQSSYGVAKHYNPGEGPIGYVGNTGVTTAHLHVHGLSSTGGRVDWRKFVSGTASGTPPQGEETMFLVYDVANPSLYRYFVGPGGIVPLQSGAHDDILRRFTERTSNTFSLAELKVITGYVNALRTGVLTIPA
jgi:hypothetical protein